MTGSHIVIDLKLLKLLLKGHISQCAYTLKFNSISIKNQS
jgi:hypothetical protein